MKKSILFVLLILISGVSNATIISSVDEATSANGNHLHSDGGNVAGVGYWDSEESRGIVEFDVSPILGSSSAIFSFAFSSFTGLLYGQDQDYLGNFNIMGYEGNGNAETSDYFQTGTLLGSYTANGLNYGDIISVNISSLLSSLSGNYLGFVFDPTGANSGAYAQETVFTNFQIEATSASEVSEPAIIALLVLGLAGIGFSRKRKIA